MSALRRFKRARRGDHMGYIRYWRNEKFQQVKKEVERMVMKERLAAKKAQEESTAQANK